MKRVLLFIGCWFYVSLIAQTNQENINVESIYLTEKKYLNSQLEYLNERLKTMDQLHESAVNKVQGDLNTSQNTLHKFVESVTLNQKKIENYQKIIDNSQDNSNLLKNVHYQMQDKLQTYQVELSDQSNPLITGFEKTIELISEFSGIKKISGTYFDSTGNQAQGKILQIGKIAKFSVSESLAQALIPIGDKQFKALDERILFNKQNLFIKLFLYENDLKPVEVKTQQSIIEYIHSGGFIAWVIVAIGFLGLTFVILRIGLLFSYKRKLGYLTPKLKKQSNLVHDDLVRSFSNSLSSKIINSLQDRLEVYREVVGDFMLKENTSIDRFSTLIMVIASVAPLLGLLGTVTGMITTFDVITDHGTGDPKLLSGGISTALLTTEFGLIVAIPLLFTVNLLSGWSKKIKVELEMILFTLFDETRKRSY